MHTLIIDAYNVIHAIPEMGELLDESLEAARIGLIKLLEEFRDARGDVQQIYVVFDGKAPGPDEETLVSPGITAVYTSTGKDADEKILEIIRDCNRPNSITVVSGDNFLYNNVRSLGGHIKTVKEFCRMFK